MVFAKAESNNFNGVYYNYLENLESPKGTDIVDHLIKHKIAEGNTAEIFEGSTKYTKVI